MGDRMPAQRVGMDDLVSPRGRMETDEVFADLPVGAAGCRPTGSGVRVVGWMYEKYDGLYAWVAEDLSRKLEEYLGSGAAVVTYVWGQKWVENGQERVDYVEYEIDFTVRPVTQKNKRSQKIRRMYRVLE